MRCPGIVMLNWRVRRVQERSEENKMNARNLGVVFGREFPHMFPASGYVSEPVSPTATLMRPMDSSKEFSDMAGKALSVEWLVLNAPEIFKDTPNNSTLEH